MAAWFTTWAFTWAMYLSSMAAPMISYLPAAMAASRSVVLTVERSVMARYLLGHALVVGRGELGAVLPVNLVAVVLRRVVAGGDVDARDAAQLAHGEGQLRGGTQGLKFVRLDAVGRQRESRLLRKLRGHAAGIVGDSHALVLASLFDDVVGKALGRPAHHINVHAVDACADDAAKSRSAELKVHIKSLFYLLLVILDGAQLLLGGLVEVWILKPFLINAHVILHNCSITLLHIYFTHIIYDSGAKIKGNGIILWLR